MARIDTKVFLKGIRMFIYVFVGMILLSFIQQQMIVAPKMAIFADDITKDNKDEIANEIISNTDLPNLDTPKLRKTLSNPIQNTDEKQWTIKQTSKSFRRSNKNSDADDIVQYGHLDMCTDQTKRNEELALRLGRLTSDMKNWNFIHKVKCPNVNISEVIFQNPRPKLSLICNRSNTSRLYVTQAKDNSDVHVAPFGDGCVDRFIQECCKGKFRIPNVVHYVWYMRGKLTFVGFTSMLSVIRFVKPCLIIFHGDSLPHGPYWNFIVNISPNIIHLKRERPEYVSGIHIKHREHSSDVMRIEALLHYGGIYMDTDTVIVKSIEPLRDYPCVMSNQSSGKMGSAFVMAEKNAKFLQLWLDGYRFHYESSKYAYNAMVYPQKIASNHSNFIHVEYGTISRPINMLGRKIYYTLYATHDWSNIYGIHLYSRIFTEPFNEFSIRDMNSTVGSISRHVVFGNKEFCDKT